MHLILVLGSNVLGCTENHKSNICQAKVYLTLDMARKVQNRHQASFGALQRFQASMNSLLFFSHKVGKLRSRG
jgi:plasmid maintenance system antidote protein VapI